MRHVAEGTILAAAPTAHTARSTGMVRRRGSGIAATILRARPNETIHRLRRAATVSSTASRSRVRSAESRLANLRTEFIRLFQQDRAPPDHKSNPEDPPP